MEFGDLVYTDLISVSASKRGCIKGYFPFKNVLILSWRLRFLKYLKIEKNIHK